MPKIKHNLETWLVPEKLELIKSWGRAGLTGKDMAHNMNIGYSTFKNWKKTNAVFAAAIDESREVADFIIEGALYKSAKGHYVTVNKPVKVKRIKYDDKGKKAEEYEEVVQATEEQYIKPEPSIQIFWAVNRMRGKWQRDPGDTSGEDQLKKAKELLDKTPSAF